MKDKIIKILEANAKEGWNGDVEAVGYYDFDIVADELLKLFNNDIVMTFPKLNDNEILEYCCLGNPNEWYKIPHDIHDMNYFTPLKIRIKKINGENIIIYNMMNK